MEIVAECLNETHKHKAKQMQFLSAHHLPIFYEYLTPLPKFEKANPMYQAQYDAVRSLVKLVAGTEDPTILVCFLQTSFPFLAARQLSWNSIFDQVESLSNNITSTSYSYEMKKLIDKFTNGNAIEFFIKMYPEAADVDILHHKVLQDLKTLCNHIESLRHQHNSNDHLLNFRRSILACFVSTHQRLQLQKK